MRTWLPSSLRLRLAAWYLVVLGTTLLVFGAIVLTTVSQSILGGVDNALLTRAETVVGQVEVGPQGVSYPPNNDAPRAEADLAVYLFDTHQRLRDRVAGATRLPPQPQALYPALHGHDGFTTIGSLRLYTVGVRDDYNRIVGAIQVVEALDGAHRQITQLVALLAVAAPLLLLVTIVGGTFIAGRALEPIERLARTAQAINARNLTHRLALQPRDDEVGRLATTFDNMMDRLEHAFAQQRQFAADASHELRTPLTIIKGDLDVLLRRRRAPEEYERVLRDVDDEVTRLNHLVEDLLILARQDSGQEELAREFIYFDKLVGDVAASMRRLADARRIILEVSLARDLAIIGDPLRLRQLVSNLLDNAVKYTTAHGRVDVTLTRSHGSARLEVTDTGIGITPEDLPHIFNRFFRADKSRGHSAGGAGLGLSIVRWCAEAHGGRVWAQSSPGQGSSFTVVLPLALTGEAADAPQARLLAAAEPRA